MPDTQSSRAPKRDGAPELVIAAINDHDTLNAAAALVEAIWRRCRGGESPISPAMLRALSHTGNYCFVARRGPEILGLSVGFLGLEPPGVLHSYLTGVRRSAAGQHIGYEIKLHQRAWAIDRGLSEIRWTYDPLVRRNAYFNQSKLGADALEYVPDFYGPLNDVVNAGQPSDRLVVSWDLRRHGNDARRPARSFAAPRAEVDAAAVLLEDDDGPPRTAAPAQIGDRCFVRVPSDIEDLRTTAPEWATRWRYALRDVLGGRMAAGDRVVDFTRDGYHVLELAARPRDAWALARPGRESK
jgi:predicted GNAT superfamily acetyltransferase